MYNDLFMEFSEFLTMSIAEQKEIKRELINVHKTKFKI